VAIMINTNIIVIILIIIVRYTFDADVFHFTTWIEKLTPTAKYPTVY
jgi:hypothetical protein